MNIFDGNHISSLEYWLQTAVPATYDDSLSFMELLGKYRNLLNSVIASQNGIIDSVQEFETAMNNNMQVLGDAASIQTAAISVASNAVKAMASETNAKASETKAKTSETNSKTSETNAKTSEINAKSSETKSKTSETNTKTSETNAVGAASTTSQNLATIIAMSYPIQQAYQFFQTVSVAIQSDEAIQAAAAQISAVLSGQFIIDGGDFGAVATNIVDGWEL